MQDSITPSAAPPDIACDVVLEQTLGHVTHGQNLRRLLEGIDGFRPRFLPVAFDNDAWTRRIPGFGNWTVRAGVRARAALRGGDRDAIFVHTQVPAVLLGRIVGRVPTVVSLDATPKQYDELGAHYAHDVGPAWIERIKTRLNQRCFERAAHLVTWAEWTKVGLATDYGIDPTKVTVIPPGVDVERWLSPADAPDVGDDGVVRILFVGGNLTRKGGFDLLAAFATLRERHGDRVELHLVTPAAVEAAAGVTVHRTMTPNSQDLIDLYHRSDVFCLPTLGDCLPMVLPEAGAAGLALVSTDVGAIREIVQDDVTGLLVPVGDVDALTSALERLIADDDLRRRLAAAASELVRREHSAATNARRIAEVVMTAVAESRR